jgi:hypothetical protein
MLDIERTSKMMFSSKMSNKKELQSIVWTSDTPKGNQLYRPAKLVDMLENPKTHNIAYGGRYGSKSYTLTLNIIIKTYQENDGNDVLVVRNTMNSLKDSCISVFDDIINDLVDKSLIPADYFQMQQDRIITKSGGSIVFKGANISTKTAYNIKSFNASKLKYVFIEEAQEISQKAFEINLLPTLTRRKDGGKVFIYYAMNPRSLDDAILKLQGDNVNKVEIQMEDCLPIVNEQNIQERDEAKLRLPKSLYEYIYYGICMGEDDALIPFDDLMRVKTLKESKDIFVATKNTISIMGVDVGYTHDYSCIAIRNGNQLLHLETLQGQEPELVARIAFLKKLHLVQVINIDNSPISHGLLNQLYAHRIAYNAVDFGGKPDDKRVYLNKRAEMFDRIRLAVGNGKLFNCYTPGVEEQELDMLIQDLQFQLIDKASDKSNILKLVSKDKIKEGLGRSPDRGDALALTYAVELDESSDDNFEDGYNEFNSTNIMSNLLS